MGFTASMEQAIKNIGSKPNANRFFMLKELIGKLNQIFLDKSKFRWIVS